MQGCHAVICMPTTTPDIKVKAVRALGGAVDLCGESYQEAQAHAQVGGLAGVAPGWRLAPALAAGGCGAEGGGCEQPRH